MLIVSPEQCQVVALLLWLSLDSTSSIRWEVKAVFTGAFPTVCLGS